ncbi:MAG: hypothetical protein NTX29_09180, partial [Actinobacteria bacterium]|nr:hypothetical protein [Actinomycetota bacterium]
LPDLRLMAPFDVEVVCGQAVRLEEVNTIVRRWAQSRRMTITQHYAPQFMETPHPRGTLATGHDKYRETLGRSVHQLVRPSK